MGRTWVLRSLPKNRLRGVIEKNGGSVGNGVRFIFHSFLAYQAA
jgi:hypothetical protein